MLGILITTNEDLDVWLLVHLLLGPFGNLFLRKLLAHHYVGTILPDIDLGQVAGGLSQGLIPRINRKIHHVVDFLLLESGRYQKEDDEDEHDIDHAGDIDNIPVLGRTMATAVHDSSVFFWAGFFVFEGARLFVDADPFVEESACCTTNSVPDSSI